MYLSWNRIELTNLGILTSKKNEIFPEITYPVNVISVVSD